MRTLCHTDKLILWDCSIFLECYMFLVCMEKQVFLFSLLCFKIIQLELLWGKFMAVYLHETKLFFCNF